MAEFIWVASFPKSGSTWMRYIIAHLLFEVDPEKTLVRAMVPNMHDWKGPLKYDWKGAYPVKTHLARHNLPKKMHTRSGIYIIRNPLDIVDSSIAYFDALDDDKARSDMINSFCTTGSIEPWNTMLGYESWESNIASWLNEPRDRPLLVMQYEDILADPHKNIERVAQFLDVDVNDKKIEEVHAATTFSSMKKQEEKEIETGGKGVFVDERLFDKKNFSFMRSGKSRGYTKNLSDQEIERLLSRFGPVMETYGYT